MARKAGQRGPQGAGRVHRGAARFRAVCSACCVSCSPSLATLGQRPAACCRFTGRCWELVPAPVLARGVQRLGQTRLSARGVSPSLALLLADGGASDYATGGF